MSGVGGRVRGVATLSTRDDEGPMQPRSSPRWMFKRADTQSRCSLGKVEQPTEKSRSPLLTLTVSITPASWQAQKLEVLVSMLPPILAVQ